MVAQDKLSSTVVYGDGATFGQVRRPSRRSAILFTKAGALALSPWATLVHLVAPPHLCMCMCMCSDHARRTYN
eukprot:scaffold39735_cov61-Phaeocystis_antarctica.AAC.4